MLKENTHSNSHVNENAIENIFVCLKRRLIVFIIRVHLILKLTVFVLSTLIHVKSIWSSVWSVIMVQNMAGKSSVWAIR